MTNGFGRSIEHTQAAFSLFCWMHNFGRKHSSLKGKSPAMVAGITDRLWTADDLAAMIQAREDAEVAAGSLKRGTYRTRYGRP